MNDSLSSSPVPATLAQWLTYLERIHPSAIDMGLERVKQVSEALHIDFSNATVITVAGTNGKGTTCRFIEQAMLSMGKTTGVYSSPHLLDYRERVRINGHIREEVDYCDALLSVEKARQAITLTYFEFGTLAAMKMMMDAKVDVIILEVGLGGRLDATNIIAPDMAVITTIGLDHMDWLGDTRDAIALEKAGIVRNNAKVVIGEPDPPVALVNDAQQRQFDAWWAGTDFSINQTNEGWYWSSVDGISDCLPLPKIPLQNAATALAVLHRLGCFLDHELLSRLLTETTLPGRRQQIASSPDVLVDVAHNPQATALMREWATLELSGTLHIVVGMLKDKSINETLAEMSHLSAIWYLGGTSGPRGLTSDALALSLNEFVEEKVNTFATVKDAYLAARKFAAKEDRILVFGSFLTVADVLALHSESSTQ